MDKRLEHNLGLKVLALISAIIMWIYVAYQNPANEQVLTGVPLTYRQLPADLKVTAIPRTVEVRLQGNQPFGRQIGVKEIQAWVDLKGAKAGTNSISVQVKMPFGVHLISVNPDKVYVRLR
ncbi:MAG TPA: hypothetical protein VHS59_06695 [Bacillota bacterium]|nr:hypothetical protein [Bacillota bacterium]